MSKTIIKEVLRPEQANLCVLSGVELPDDPSLFDVDRILERFNGGTYNDIDNCRAVDPRAHMARHGILREREDWLEHLKAFMDDRAQTMKLLMKISNQMLAYKRRTDHAVPEIEAFLASTAEPVAKRIKAIDAQVTKHLKAGDDPLIAACLGVVGVGPISVAGLLTYVDLAKADSPSALWAYVGMDKPSHSRYAKGEAGGGNKTLRTILWNMANSMMKNKDCPYRLVYDQVKTRLEKSDKVVKSRNTQGMMVEVPWSQTKPSHRHGAALRAIVKHFLADYWMVGRMLKGLPTRTLYVEQHMGHDGIIKPDARGWKV